LAANPRSTTITANSVDCGWKLAGDDAEAEREMPPADRAPRQRAPRKPLSEHLSRDEKVYLSATTDCPACGGNLKQLGEDVAVQLEFVPASFRVIRNIRPQTSLRVMGCHFAGASAKPADRAWHHRTWLAGTRAGRQVRRPPFAERPDRDLCARRRRS
jgi:hypothetical protein